MSYLEQITIGIPVRIDSWERKRNLLALLHYISSSGMRVHVWDAGSEECQFPDDICSKITYTYERDENLVYQINKELKENNSEKMFYCVVRKYEEDLDLINIAYSNESDITKINKVLNKSNLDITEFKKDAKSTSI